MLAVDISFERGDRCDEFAQMDLLMVRAHHAAVMVDVDGMQIDMAMAQSTLLEKYAVDRGQKAVMAATGDQRLPLACWYPWRTEMNTIEMVGPLERQWAEQEKVAVSQLVVVDLVVPWRWLEDVGEGRPVDMEPRQAVAHTLHIAGMGIADHNRLVPIGVVVSSSCVHAQWERPL